MEVPVSNDILDDTEVLGMMDNDKDGLSNDAEEDIEQIQIRRIPMGMIE